MFDAPISETLTDQPSPGGVPSLHALHPPRTRRKARRRRPVGGAPKRIFDFVVASLALIALSPLLLLVALAIKLESPGPVLFLQRRGGTFGRPFLIYKFRTMRSADDGRRIEQVVHDDPRVTRLGAVLRELCIDELPQLINVIRGEMSLVGPRPHAVAHDEAFERMDSRYRRRQRARPGITGLAQVSGCRGLAADLASVRARTGHDIDYVNDWSLKLDFAILFKTVLLVLRLRSDRHSAPVLWRRAC